MVIKPTRKGSDSPPTDRTESITEYTLCWQDKDVTRVVVYRLQQRVDQHGAFDLEDQDIIDTIAKFHPTYLGQIVESLLDLPKVVRVQATRLSDGKGMIVYA